MLSWNEIKDRATRFSREWAGETRETGEYQSFWNDFFDVFGIKRRSVALYQNFVERIDGGRGFIDLFWPGKLLVEHKTAGKDLESAFLQASDYMLALPEEQRPQYVIVSDYVRIRLYNLEREEKEPEYYEFLLKDFPKHVRLFAFMPGYEVRRYQERESAPVNRKAVKLVVELYRALVAGLYPPEHISRFLVRLVFCFFADDTGIFEPDAFYSYLFYRSNEDGSDFGSKLGEVFQVLNTPEDRRQPNMDEDLGSLPYVNGGLFADPLPVTFFTRDLRKAVLHATEFNWSAVSPAIFGSMFQFVMDADNESIRHDFGAHYTSEKNILKVIHGLFFDDLEAELVLAGQNQQKLKTLWEKIGAITLLDPACGCGNFLVVAYRELRHLEIEILKRLYDKEIKGGQQASLPMDVMHLSKFSVERMFGIEILPFPAEIAQLSLWLADHLSNVELGNLFGKPFVRLPLLERPHILCANALTADWETLIPKAKLSYILGNPPFLGSKLMNQDQREEITDLFQGKQSGILDYVTGWYFKASQYIQGTKIKCAFVSTNSITQGEQVAALWKVLLEKYAIRINFAHRTFKWSNEAPGKAVVFCVVIGFAASPPDHARIFDYETVQGEAHEIKASEINPYLIDAPVVFVESRSKPLCDVPRIKFGNQPLDGGFLTFTTEEKVEFLREEPNAEKFFKPFLGAKEFLNGGERWCLWLTDIQPEQLRNMPVLFRRIEMVKTFRLLSKRKDTRKLAETPTLFSFISHPNSTYLLIPRHSSETRAIIPMGYMPAEMIAGDSCLIIPKATLFHFGVLQSKMHMSWVKSVCGRIKSDYRYSNALVYNNFPWPENISDELEATIKKAGQAVLDARTAHPKATLADLYDPLSMPKDLLDAHKALDHAVDRAYGTRSFKTEQERLEFLFGLYRKYTEIINKS